MSKKKLLFPTDFSDDSLHALKETCKLNEVIGYEIVLFHAYSRPVNYQNSDAKNVLYAVENRVDDKLSKMADSVSELKNFKFSLRKRLGYSVEMIQKEIEDDGIGLVVMSTKGAVGVGELFGTRTAKIIKSIDVPIIVIPPKTRLSSIERIGLACDFSDNTEFDKLGILIELASRLKVGIDIITLNRHEKTMIPSEIENRKQVLQRMKNLPAKLNYEQHDSIDHGLITFCKKNNIGLIGILPKSYNFIEGLFHDSLTQQLAFHSPVPLLVLK